MTSQTVSRNVSDNLRWKMNDINSKDRHVFSKHVVSSIEEIDDSP